ncbi:hypothetical protein X943_000930 [Babesia divergens]|uniref:Uncharacterized protein n=1 Tax=Babesia divergens TaxID=32595 RepID=A0AAD9LI70_BABDI|nr:hypothetical protein X943_000930 [Babesia divergens]
MEGAIDANMPDPADSQNHERVFYRPDRQLYTRRRKIINQDECARITEGWPLSEGFKTHGMHLGSLLDNNFPWQNKWYLRFEPPKSPDDLEIGQYWRYDGPRLQQFIASDASARQSVPPLTKMSLSSLKSLSVKILSGVTQASLVENAYHKTVGGRGSMITDRDCASSVVSQPRIPEAPEGPKRSILEALTAASKKNLKSRSNRA